MTAPVTRPTSIITMRRVMFVCERNVCRSPLMAAVAEARTGPGWITSSQGTRAVAGHAWCGTSRMAVIAAGITPVDHLSTPLDAAALAKEDLVIAASRAERAAIAKVAPALRPRTFTLREALRLAAAPLNEVERATIRARSVGLASVLNARRGMIDPPVEPRGVLRWIGRTTDPWDVEDVHGLSDRRHRGGMRELEEQTARFAAFLDDAVSV